MSEEPKAIGSISWTDLTVDNADEVRSFYESVLGWSHQAVDMGEYQDFCMVEPEGGQVVAGICHAKGQNSALPPQWLIYVNVVDLVESLTQCTALGGQILQAPRNIGSGLVAVIRDPAGAVLALYQHGPSD